MKSSISRSIIIVMVMAFVALLINAVIPVNALHQLDKSHTESEIIREKVSVLDSIMQSLFDAQNSVRGYAISNNPAFLEPLYKARGRLNDQLKQLQQSSHSPSREHPYLPELRNHVTDVMEHLQVQIDTQQTQGAAATLTLIAKGEGKRRMEAARSVHEAARDLEQNRLDTLEARERKIHLYTNSALIALTIFDLILFIAAFTLLFNALKSARRTEERLGELHAETLKRGEVLALKNKNKNIQARLNDVLQSILTPEEAYAAIQKYCANLFPEYAGALYIRSNSKDYFELKASWNDADLNSGFEPDQCWAARNNQTYEYNDEDDDLPCQHVEAGSGAVTHSICLPISSPDEMIGIMNLVRWKDAEHAASVDVEVKKLALEVVNQIGLAITNLRLRDSLRRSSIVDALTGLFNRRYLDETMIREIARAQRSKESIGVIMLDIDHFKDFNDNYGHDAGDLALRELGPVLKKACRASDVACRYGGEEFLLILPQANLEVTINRANAIRNETKKIKLVYGGAELPSLSVSLGVSLFPLHAEKAEDVFRAAERRFTAQRKRVGIEWKWREI